MKRMLLTLCVAGCLVVAQGAFAATKKVTGGFAACRSTTTLPNGLYIYKNSAPLRNARGIMIGLRYEPTLILAKTRSAARSTTIFNSKGKALASCPWAPADGTVGGRMRCTMQTSSLRRAAVSSAGSPKVFFAVGGGKCVAVPDAGACYGSFKGGCNRTIK